MIVQHLMTDNFGEGICIYRAEFKKPEDYEGDMNKKIAGPFMGFVDAEAWLKGQGIEKYNIL
jgi:hypothetical protein